MIGIIELLILLAIMVAGIVGLALLFVAVRAASRVGDQDESMRK